MQTDMLRILLAIFYGAGLRPDFSYFASLAIQIPQLVVKDQFLVEPTISQWRSLLIILYSQATKKAADLDKSILRQKLKSSVIQERDKLK